MESRRRPAARPILIVPYMWIGDFVRCHSVVRLLQCALSRPPGRRADHADGRPAGRLHAGRAQGHRLRPAAQRLAWSHIGRSPPAARRSTTATPLIMPRTWKSALAPALAGIPRPHRLRRRNAVRPDQRLALGRKGAAPHDRQLAALALPKGAALPPEWPLPQLVVPPTRRCRLGGSRMGLGRWAPRWRCWRRARSALETLAGCLSGSSQSFLAEQGFDVWVIGGPGEKALAAEIVAAGGPRVPRPHRAPTCATASWRWRRPTSRSPTIPA